MYHKVYPYNSYNDLTVTHFMTVREALRSIFYEDLAGKIQRLVALEESQYYMFSERFLEDAATRNLLPGLDYPWIAECYIYDRNYMPSATLCAGYFTRSHTLNSRENIRYIQHMTQ